MTTTERPHGRNKYTREGCRCDICRAANARYENTRKLHPTNLIDAEPARQHVAYLRSNGIGTRQIAALTGISRQSIQALIGGRSQRPTDRIRLASAARILAITPGVTELIGGQRIDAVGARRRLQALARIGWSCRQLARRLDVTPGQIHKLLHADRVYHSTAIRIRDLYEQLWDAPPPGSTPVERRGAELARRRAIARGWAPPVAWDDDTIDDPAATPEGIAGPTARRRKLPTADELRYLLQTDSQELVAARFGVSVKTLRGALARADQRAAS